MTESQAESPTRSDISASGRIGLIDAVELFEKRVKYEQMLSREP